MAISIATDCTSVRSRFPTAVTNVVPMPGTITSDELGMPAATGNPS